MKIRLLSDLHLEGNNYYYQYQGEDVVVLAGDIHTQGRHSWFLDQIPSNVKVLMVAGNHEYYGAVYEWVNAAFRELEETYPNFTFLNNESVIIDDVEFFGGTMFTDMNLYGDYEQACDDAQRGIADFSWISREVVFPPDFDSTHVHRTERLWTPADHMHEHMNFCRALDTWKREPKQRKRVVISHFVPHPEVSDARFKGSRLNPYFIANMRQYFADIDVWMFGHTHSSHDSIMEGCRFVCNPHGYGQENFGGFNCKMIVEI